MDPNRHATLTDLIDFHKGIPLRVADVGEGRKCQAVGILRDEDAG